MDRASLSRFRSKSLGGTVCKWTGVTLFLGSLTVIGILEASAVGQRHYTCYRAAGPIIVDGKLDEPSWKSAPRTEPFVDTRGEDYPEPYFDTRVWMLWDDSYLYVAADLEETDVWATQTERDAYIYRYDNDFEVFIDPNGDELEYYELEMNALNTVWDLFLNKPYNDGGHGDDSWDIEGLKSGVHVNGTLNHPGDIDQSWSVEIAFPWEVLAEYAHKAAPPNSGDIWRMTFCRVAYRVDVVDGRYKMRPETRQDWLWAPQRTWVHDPEDWGYVYFSTDEVDTAPVVVSATTTLAATVGQPTLLEPTVVLDRAQNTTGDFRQMRLDLSSIGLSSTFDLNHEGAGQYTASITITPPQTGRYYLPVVMESAEGGGWYRLFTVTLDVYPDGDLSIYEEGLSTSWTVQTVRGAESDLTSSKFVHSGHFSHAVLLWSGGTPGQVKYVFDDPAGINTFGYTHLEFYINGGEASGQNIYIGNKKLSDLGVVPQSDTWTLVSIPLSEASLDKGGRLTSIPFGGAVKETFYLDDMKLLAEQVPTAVEEISAETAVPLGYALSQNYPNPFNPQTVIRYDLPQPGAVRLCVYNVLGQMVRTLVAGYRPAGSYSVVWDGRDGTGRDVASGVYLYRLKAEGQYVQTRRMVLLR